MTRADRPRLLVIATHPIQYHAPWFRHLAASGEVDLVVGFLDMPDAASQGVGFGVEFEWDVPLTEGYRWIRFEGRFSGRNRDSGFFWLQLRRARGQIRAAAADAVLITGWHQIGLLQAWWAARSLGIPVIVRGESNAKRNRARWKRWFHGRLLGKADAFVTIGRSNAEFYRSAGVPDEHLHAGAYFVDNDFFASRADALDRTEVRDRFGIPEGVCCVLFAGKFESKKRPFDLLSAVAALDVDSRKRVHLLMVGSGELGDSLKEQAAGLPVTWAGFLNQTEIPAAYRAADVLVLPSDHGETWGLVVNEAMACGVPAIVGDKVGCADDLVVDGETGWVYPTGDVARLRAAIEQAVSRPEECVRRGERARHKVHSDYTIERSSDALFGAIGQVLARSRREHTA
jgi:glycosyltransferase involved in cell wall biosynthesis